MKVLEKIVLLLGLACVQHLAFAQGYVVSPTIPDFMDLNARCVVATYGNTDDPFLNTGVVNGRHTVISHQGTDPSTGGGLSLMPPGASKVVRLGNFQTNAEAESITYHFIVDANKSILLLKFAVVFQDPSHRLDEQPRFKVRIMDKDGNLIESCAEYDVSARPEIEGFNSYNKAGIPVRWRDWTSVGLDMSAYAGREVQVQFVTYDCELYGHYGYAYFTASCVSSKLSLNECNGNNFTASAPEDFASYLWHNGDTTSATRWVKGVEDMNLTCEIASVTGCRFTLSGYVAGGELPTESKTIYDTICEGDPYTDNYYNLPPHYEIGDFTYYNTFFDLNTCRADVTNILFLNVQQRYYPIEARICQGMDYMEHGFDFRQPAIGIHYDTLRYVSAAGCDSIIPLKLTVDFSFSTPNDIIGDAHPCFGNTSTYWIPNEAGFSYSRWDLPAGFYVIDAPNTTSLRVQVSDQAKPGAIVFHGGNGCGNGQISFAVDPNPSYWQSVADSICLGDEYHGRGFHLPRNDSSGIYSYTQFNTTRKGCDSTLTLHLYVFEKPSVRIETLDSVLCQGNTVTLHALGKNASFSPQFVPKVAIGDLLCANNEIVKPDKYAGSGKTAIGIVFFVDMSGEHGWAVNVRNESDKCIWSSLLIDISSLPNMGTYDLGCVDTAGYRNTKLIRAAGNAASYPAAWTVDFANGWYIPAVAQLNQLFSVMSDLDFSNTLVGGSPFFGTATYYWGSTEYDFEQVWGVDNAGTLGRAYKYPVAGGILRSVRSF